MRAVSRFESNLLRILHCFMGQTPAAQVLSAIVRPCERPRCLSRDAVELIQQALAKGVVKRLARVGDGWKTERFLRDGQMREGTIWQRSGPEELGLRFSPLSIEMLMWITETDFEARIKPWNPRGEPEFGDSLLQYLALRALHNYEVAAELRKQPAFHNNALAVLMFADEFGSQRISPHVDFTPWMSGAGGCLLEALQSELTQRWVRMEERKRAINKREQMRTISQTQAYVLKELFDAAEKASRRDLCRFLLPALRRLLRPEAEARDWVKSLDVEGSRLSHRVEIYRAAFAVLRECGRLKDWQLAARSVGYFDDGYAESQLWKADWEAYNGDESSARASQFMRELEPMSG